MRILVTGGAGYVGSVSVEALVDAGHQVTAVDNLATASGAADLAGAELLVGTYTDRAFMADALRERSIEAVLHCGARSLVGESMREPALYFRENVAGGIALLEAMRDAGVNGLVISSTASVYGIPETSPVAEDAPLHPINVYGESKRSLEAIAGWFGRAYGLRVVSLRYFNVAGASARNGERHDPETHLIPNVLTAAIGGAPLTIFGTDYPTPDGTAIRDYVHVLDLADAHRLALEATADGGPAAAAEPQLLNLGSGAGLSVRQVLHGAERVIGRSVPHAYGERRAGDPPVLVASIERARAILGWEPLRSSLDEMVASAWTEQQARTS